VSVNNQFPKATIKRSVFAAQAMGDFIYAPVLACDLDGTIRYNHEDPDDYIDGPETVAVYEGVEEKLWEYYREGYLIAGITNQGGVAFDFKTPEQVQAENHAMVKQFDRNPFIHIQSCLSHDDGEVSPYDRRSLLRKPNVGMLAILEEDLRGEGYLPNWDESIIVGDMQSDRELANRADVEFEFAHQFFEREPNKHGSE
jgi:histidinol phosphatase-like enzyme